MAEIRAEGLSQTDLVALLDRLVGRIWIPHSAFSDIGNAAGAAVGSSKPTGLAFDQTTAEEADVTILVPKDFDETVLASMYIYWSSSAVVSTNGVVWDIDYVARAIGEDMGVAVTNLTTTDLDSATADALNRTAALTLPADTVAVDDLLNLNLRREAADGSDTVTVQAEFYGIQIDYTSKPKTVVN